VSVSVSVSGTARVEICGVGGICAPSFVTSSRSTVMRRLVLVLLVAGCGGMAQPAGAPPAPSVDPAAVLRAVIDSMPGAGNLEIGTYSHGAGPESAAVRALAALLRLPVTPKVDHLDLPLCEHYRVFLAQYEASGDSATVVLSRRCLQSRAPGDGFRHTRGWRLGRGPGGWRVVRLLDESIT
jgi:hypothetical protein